jgi:hypothetical protein
MGYHSFTAPHYGAAIDELGNAYGSFVIEFIAADPYLEPGWYWTACFPSCLNDSDPQGPFETSEDAMRDACHA